MSSDKRTFVPCEADCHVLGAIVSSDEHLVYLSFYVGSFYAGQESFFYRWRRRLGAVLTLLLGRDYQFEDIVLSRQSAAQLGALLGHVEEGH